MTGFKRIYWILTNKRTLSLHTEWIRYAKYIYYWFTFSNINVREKKRIYWLKKTRTKKHFQIMGVFLFTKKILWLYFIKYLLKNNYGK